MVVPGGVMRRNRSGSIPALGWAAQVACLLLFAVLVIATRRGMESWSSADYGLYIMHARNLVEGLPYAATGYVPNPDNTIISPAAYPLGYPLLLAIPYAVSGIDLFALELVGCCALIAIVAGVWVLARRHLPDGWAFLVAIGTGFVPELLDLRDTISSDLAFTAWVLLALCLHERTRGTAGLAALFVAVFMAEATRSAGLALGAALIGADILSRTPAWRARAIATAAAMGAAMLANHYVRADAAGTYLSYFSRLNEGPTTYLAHATTDYLVGLSHALGLSFGKMGNLVGVSLFLGTAAIGWIASLRRGITAAALFLPASAALLLAFPVRLETARYLVPLLPLLVFYMVSGAALLSKGRTIGLIAAAMLLLVSAGGRFVQSNPFAPLPQPRFDASLGEELRQLGRVIPKGHVVLARNPRVTALYSGAQTTVWDESPSTASLWQPSERMGATYLMVENVIRDGDERRIASYVAARPDSVVLVKQTPHYRLFRFRP